MERLRAAMKAIDSVAVEAKDAPPRTALGETPR